MNPYDDEALRSLAELFEEIEQMEDQFNAMYNTNDEDSVGTIPKMYSDDLRPICFYVAGPNTLQ